MLEKTAPGQKRTLRRGLSTRHIRFIALGSTIGTGLFYGSGKAINLAGPAVLIAYVMAGIVIYLVMRSLGEMAVRNPVTGSFSYYATKYIGPFAGFSTGWTYVFEMIIVALADVTAFGIYMGFWFPDAPRWIWIIAIVLLISGLNLIHVKVFGEIEFWLSIVKIAAICAMIVGGIALMIFGVTIGGQPGFTPGIENLWDQPGGFFPHGIGGLIACLTVVVFAFGGTEIIGITAGESKEPEKSIPKAINSVPARIVLFYVLTIGVLLMIFPWRQIGDHSSPFVQIFESLGFPFAASVLNIIVIFAAISAINSDTFGAGRILYGMAQKGQAPHVFTKVSKNGVPWMTIVLMAFSLLIGALLNFLIPEGIFSIIAAIATFATMWVWMMILFSQIAMRRRMSTQELKELRFPVLGWPYAQVLAIFFLGFVFIAMAFFPETQPALIVGILWLCIIAIGYYVWENPRRTSKNLNDKF